MNLKLLVPLATFLLALGGCPLAAFAQGSPSVTLGDQEVVLNDGRYGLHYFPDETLSVFRTPTGWRMMMAAGVRSVLLEGPSIEALAGPRDILLPGKAGAFDNGYAGISAVWRTGAGELLAIYHAEDHEGIQPNDAGIPGFYCQVALAVSKDDGATFEKRGPIVSGQLRKVAGGRFDQGLGEPCLVAGPEGKYLYLYYSSHERIGGRGVQICLARCRLEDAAKPGAWSKYFDGGFSEPGLGGRDTPVMTSGAEQTDALFPHVVYLPAFQRFVMIFCVNAWNEGDQPQRSGFYAAFSKDGVHWPRDAVRQIWKTPVIAALNRPVGWHPTLILDDHPATGGISGWLYYGYSESWGDRPPNKPHYLVRRPISFARSPAD